MSLLDPAPLRRWHTREDSGFRLDAEGRLWHDEVLVENPRVLAALRQGIEREEGGRYLIHFGWDWCVLQVEDVPYQVLGLRSAGGGLQLALDDGREVQVQGSALSASNHGILYAEVPGRGVGLAARFSRAAQGQIAPFLDEREGHLVVHLGSELTRIPPR